MESSIILKQIFFTNYDKIKFDILTLENVILVLLKNENSISNSQIITILNDASCNIFQDNIAIALNTMIYFLEKNESYSIDKVLKNIFAIICNEKRRKLKYDYYKSIIWNL